MWEKGEKKWIPSYGVSLKHNANVYTAINTYVILREGIKILVADPNYIFNESVPN